MKTSQISYAQIMRLFSPRGMCTRRIFPETRFQARSVSSFNSLRIKIASGKVVVNSHQIVSSPLLNTHEKFRPQLTVRPDLEQNSIEQRQRCDNESVASNQGYDCKLFVCLCNRNSARIRAKCVNSAQRGRARSTAP